MEVEITLSLGIEKFTARNCQSCTMEVPNDSRIRTIIKILELPDNEPWLIVLNGKQAFLETKLSPGDRIRIFPMIAGG